MTNEELEERIKELELTVIRFKHRDSKRDVALNKFLHSFLEYEKNIMIFIAAAADQNKQDITNYAEISVQKYNNCIELFLEVIRMKIEDFDFLGEHVSQILGEPNE